MTMPSERECPGCGVWLPISDGWPDERFNASPECFHLYGELTAYTVTRGDRETMFIHQLAVDTYAAQHVGLQAKLIGVAFALIGLYLVCERGYTGLQVQHMHMLLARRSKTWPRFDPPASRGDVTVLDVMRAAPGEARDAAIRRWTESVWGAWGAWSAEHARVRELFETVMAD